MRDATRAAATALRWAGDGPVVLGGDFNIRGLHLKGFELAAAHGVDYVFARGLRPVASDVPDRGRLSDHAPVRADLTTDPGPAR